MPLLIEQPSGMLTFTDDRESHSRRAVFSLPPCYEPSTSLLPDDLLAHLLSFAPSRVGQTDIITSPKFSPRMSLDAQVLRDLEDAPGVVLQVPLELRVDGVDFTCSERLGEQWCVEERSESRKASGKFRRPDGKPVLGVRWPRRGVARAAIGTDELPKSARRMMQGAATRRRSSLRENRSRLGMVPSPEFVAQYQLRAGRISHEQRECNNCLPC